MTGLDIFALIVPLVLALAAVAAWAGERLTQPAIQGLERVFTHSAIHIQLK